MEEKAIAVDDGAGIHMHPFNRSSASSSSMHTLCPHAIPCAIKYFCTSSPYAECRSGARTRSEQLSGKPPPRMSSKEGMPVEVMKLADVDDELGEYHVPGGSVCG